MRKTTRAEEKSRARTSAVRLLAVGAAAWVASSIANVVVATALKAILNLPSDFAQIAPPAIISITLVGVAAAVIVFAIVARVAADPVTDVHHRPDAARPRTS